MRGTRPLKKAEIRALLKKADSQREKALILCGLYLGCRISEALRLRFGDFKGQTVRVKSLKGSNDRNLILPVELSQEICKLRSCYEAKGLTVSDDTYLFIGQKSSTKPISRQHGCYLIKQIKEKAKLVGRVAFHSFRKTFTTKIFKLCKYNLPQVAVYTGHKSLNSLQAYIETCQETNLTRQLGWI